MTAREAAEAMGAGVREVCPDARIVSLPIGDGGEGTVEAVVSSLKDVETVECETVDPLHRPLKAVYSIVGGKTAFIESAAASGLTLVQESERDIMRADTKGTGILMADALKRGVNEIVVCMGGTATCDGGYGAYQVMRDYDWSGIRFTLLCDVENPLCGSEGAAYIFAPQKGASPEQLPVLDGLLAERAEEYKASHGIDVRNMKYAGAAGGLAEMLMACYGATPVKGIDFVVKLLDLPYHLQGADLVLTGEGKADATTLCGKAAHGILDVSRKFNVPVALIAGKVADRETLLSAGFTDVVAATPTVPDPGVGYSRYLTCAVAGWVRKWLENRENLVK